MKQTLFDKVWDDHVVTSFDDGTCLLYIDRIFLHERTGSTALVGLQTQGRVVRNPQQAFCTMDHIVDTHPGRDDTTSVPGGSEFIRITRDRASAEKITLFDLGDPRQGISHVENAGRDGDPRISDFAGIVPSSRSVPTKVKPMNCSMVPVISNRTAL